jgi:TolB-like protein/DNA-binding winged helix-turn-helix (wHTH) protein
MNDGTFGRAPSPPEPSSVPETAANEPEISPSCYRFETFEIDGQRRELRHNGLKIHLKGRPFTLLKVLVESQGRLVTREELRGHLWTSDTHVDFDANLTTAFYKLRKALGDSSRESRFIETIPGQGYRFIEPVVAIKREAATPTLEAPADNHETDLPESTTVARQEHTVSPLKRRLVSALVASLVLLVIACVGYIRVLSSSAAHSKSVRLVVLPFADNAGNATDENFSDGLQDELITELTRRHASEFSVIARTTAMTYKHTGKSVQQIARELDVSYVVEGAVQQCDGRMHISARLVRAADQSEIWADSYDRPLGDAVKSEFEVADRIGDALSARVLPTIASAGQRTLNSSSYLKQLLLR